MLIKQRGRGEQTDFSWFTFSEAAVRRPPTTNQQPDATQQINVKRNTREADKMFKIFHN